jgi:hypothetical protein
VNAVRWVVLCAVSSGCTAAKAQFQILAAEESLHNADEVDAARLAAFEHQMAELYLAKAKEKAGYSEYRIADALARKSSEWAGRASIFVESQGKVEVRVEDFTEDAGEQLAPEAPMGEVPEPEPEPLFGDEEDIDIQGVPGKPPAPKPPSPKP